MVKIKTSQRSLLGIQNGSILSKRELSKEMSSNIQKTSKKKKTQEPRDTPTAWDEHPEINRDKDEDRTQISRKIHGTIVRCWARLPHPWSFYYASKMSQCTGWNIWLWAKHSAKVWYIISSSGQRNPMKKTALSPFYRWEKCDSKSLHDFLMVSMSRDSNANDSKIGDRSRYNMLPCY